MKIIVTKLTAGAGVRDVMTFFKAGLKRRFPLPLRAEPKVENCQIIRIVDDDGGPEEFIAVLNVSPEKEALRAIQRLNRTQLKGRLVEVRQYRYRSSRNDRRSRRYPVANEHERRADDRRRPNLKFERQTGPARIEAMDNFRRTYGY
jgi:hypothetical protein